MGIRNAGNRPEQPSGNRAAAIPMDAFASGSYRGQERKKFRKQVTVCEVDESGTPCGAFECDGLDISQSGIGFRSRRQIAAGRAVVVVATTAGGNPHAFYGVVRHSSYGEGATYHTGVEFRAMPEAIPLRTWLRQQGLAA